jgi:hypothetical protein
VPPEIWAVIQKMIAKKAEDRYQSLRETIVDLRRYSDRTQDDKSQCPSCGAKNPKGGSSAAVRRGASSCSARRARPRRRPGARRAACGADIGRLVKIKKAMESAARFKSLGDLRRAAESYVRSSISTRRTARRGPSSSGSRARSPRWTASRPRRTS